MEFIPIGRHDEREFRMYPMCNDDETHRAARVFAVPLEHRFAFQEEDEDEGHEKMMEEQ